jgi:phosphoenolpyruvate-protein kinase (PTS system EI component)
MLMANVGSAEEARAAAAAGAEGIGLLRTEFLFAQRASLPSAAEQADLYTDIIRAFGSTSAPIIIRLLDAGADKPLPALAARTGILPPEANPALGLRGIRLLLAYEDLLAAQFAGILLAMQGTGANVRVMLPMVATVGELRRSQALLAATRRQLEQRGETVERTPPLGIMIETPAAVLCAEALAREAAFFSIGTNDLTQYITAADRLNPRLADLAQPLQPPVLHAIFTVAREATRCGRHAGVCGEMASDPALAQLLVGLGIRELSMAPSSLVDVRAALAARTLGELDALAHKALQADSVAEVRHVVDSDWGAESPGGRAEGDS